MKKLFLILLLGSSIYCLAQEGTASPYSFYGIGDVKFKGTNEYRNMAGISAAVDSIHLNLLNPASYSRLKLATFAIGGTSLFTNLSNTTIRESANRTSIDYLALAFPIGKKIGLAFGIMPFSSVGYKVSNISDTELKYFSGEGGVNKVFIGTALNISKELSFGADFNYFFGDINTNSSVFIPNVIYGTKESNSSNLSGGSVNLGFLYTKKIKNKYIWNTSLNYSPEIDLNMKNNRYLVPVFQSSNGAILENPGEDNQNIVTLVDNNARMKLAQKISFGTGFGVDKKWFLGVDYTVQEKNNQTNRFDDITNASFQKSERYAIGGYFIPKYDSFSNYWSRIVYRAGYVYENTGLIISNTEIKDYGMNFGLGFPVTGSFSNINLGFEFGKRGTKENNLVQENYFNVSLGLSLNDLWFKKRKYD